ncbi:NUDIX domain-containing protein [Streptomyces sp. CA-181903]|uniref:NUDIX domain-containing protein n=1 Tax=Streptomyces sp. CA-181903 TaxID=3240055 RepID=UPI003D9249C7
MSDTETFETIRYAADIVAVTPSGRVLLIRRKYDPYQGLWALPGGHVDRGERAVDAAARELEEETGVHVAAADLTLIGVYDRPDRDPRARYVSVAYRAAVPEDTHDRAGDDATDTRWVPITALPDLAFDHAQILADARAMTP